MRIHKDFNIKDYPYESKELTLGASENTSENPNNYNYIYDQEFYSEFVEKVGKNKDLSLNKADGILHNTYSPVSCSFSAPSYSQYSSFKQSPNSKPVSPDSPKPLKNARYSKQQVKILAEAFYRPKGDSTFYITRDEAKDLCVETGLNERQVSKWFSNKRVSLRKNGSPDYHL